jgi:NADH-ubiquinone oxidoreductase chain 5
MEGPTPVSALIHAATMVTAGIYLLIRSSPILDFVRKILILIAIVGGLTAIVSALIGLVQTDIKKVIAFSTCSQLGYMVLSCGLSLYEVSLFHLVTHAIFKALLFLSAGSIIHSLSNEQNLLQFGNLIKFLRFTYICILTGSLALGGFRFLAGFYSKDTILELLTTNLYR